MKNITTIIAALTLTLVSVNVLAGQDGGTNTATASANATVKVIQPISITKQKDLNFGVIAASNQDGTVVISTAGVRTPSNGITLPAQFTSQAAGEFKVTGEDNANFSITFPNSIDLGTGNDKMTVTNFTENSDNKLNGNEDIFQIGATLNVNKNQAAGTYTNSFDVTVTYE